MNTFSLLSDLQNDIGPRRAGTAAEREALEWLERHCYEFGWHPERHPFRYIGSQVYNYGLSLLILAAGLAAPWLPSWTGLALFVLVYGAVTAWRKYLELRLARIPSENLLAGLHRPFSEYTADPEPPPALIFCAHYDTARCMPRWFLRMYGFERIALPLALMGILLYAVLKLLFLASQLLIQLFTQAGQITVVLDQAARWGGWVATIMIIPLFAYVFLLFLSSLLGRQQDAPGADDNGSGVAVLLELGRRLSKSPPPDVEIFLAFWGAEEQGLYGSRQFIREFGTVFPPERTAVVNVDCVGVGEYITLYAGRGILRRRATDPRQISRLQAISQKHGVPTIHMWESLVSGSSSSDHAEWIDRGYNLTASLIREDYCRPSLPARILGTLLRIPHVAQLELKHPHSPEDTLEGIIPERLEATTAIAEEFGRQMVAELRQHA